MVVKTATNLSLVDLHLMTAKSGQSATNLKEHTTSIETKSNRMALNRIFNNTLFQIMDLFYFTDIQSFKIHREHFAVINLRKKYFYLELQDFNALESTAV